MQNENNDMTDNENPIGKPKITYREADDHRTDLLDLAEQIPENREVIERLGPGFEDYETTKNEFIKSIRKPVVHGTGSYALEKILREGLVSRSGDSVVSGERAMSGTGDEDIRPISLADMDSMGRGEITAHLYSSLATKDNQLSFEASKALGVPKLDFYLKSLGIPDLKDAIVAKFTKYTLESQPDKNPEESKRWVEKEMEERIKQVDQPGTNMFDPEKVQASVDRLEAVIDGSSNEDLGQVLFEMGVLNDLRYYYTEKGSPPLPLSEYDHLIEMAERDIEKPESLVIKIIEKKIQAMKDKIKTYADMPSEVRESIENQFPVVMIIEGEGLELKPVNWMLVCQELHTSDQISPERIRQIRVPEVKVDMVKTLLEDKGLGNIQVIPIEYFELEKSFKF